MAVLREHRPIDSRLLQRDSVADFESRDIVRMPLPYIVLDAVRVFLVLTGILRNLHPAAGLQDVVLKLDFALLVHCSSGSHAVR
jgi:hypothetical protein